MPDVDFTMPCGVVVFSLFYCHLDLYCGACYVGCLPWFPTYVSVVCVLCLTVLMNCLLNAFAISVGEVDVFSLNVIVFFCGLISVLSSVCVCCVCDPSVCLGVPPYVTFVCLYEGYDFIV